MLAAIAMMSSAGDPEIAPTGPYITSLTHDATVTPLCPTAPNVDVTYVLSDASAGDTYKIYRIVNDSEFRLMLEGEVALAGETLVMWYGRRLGDERVPVSAETMRVRMEVFRAGVMTDSAESADEEYNVQGECPE
jgi:hypothetical protein